jgi:1-deoxy-D-xylulose-5-phosphate reductoisomerase
MGGKITIDSATMMNKGLELIEAHWLFGLEYDRIDIIVHPESVIHSLVEFADGSQVAQLGLPDMRLPIQYALTYPRHETSARRRLSLTEIAALHFSEPDPVRFPALRLAREAGQAGKTYPTVLSAADEVAVSAFHAGRIRFIEIAELVARCLTAHSPFELTDFDAVAEADAWARDAAAAVARDLSGRR